MKSFINVLKRKRGIMKKLEPSASSQSSGYPGNHKAHLGDWSRKNTIRKHSFFAAQGTVPGYFKKTLSLYAVLEIPGTFHLLLEHSEKI